MTACLFIRASTAKARGKKLIRYQILDWSLAYIIMPEKNTLFSGIYRIGVKATANNKHVQTDTAHKKSHITNHTKIFSAIIIIIFVVCWRISRAHQTKTYIEKLNNQTKQFSHFFGCSFRFRSFIGENCSIELPFEWWISFSRHSIHCSSLHTRTTLNNVEF